jgi:hypothetical protein
MDPSITKIENEIMQEFHNNIREYKNLLKRYDDLLKEMKIEPTKRENFNAKFVLLLKKMPSMIDTIFKQILNHELEIYYHQLNSSELFSIWKKNYDIKDVIKMILYKNKNDGWNEEMDYYEYKINCFLSEFFKKCLFTIFTYLFSIIVIAILYYIYM